MKAEMTLPNGHNPNCVNVIADIHSLSQRTSAKLISTECLHKSKNGKFIIPIEKLTEIQIQQVMNLPGAYLLSDEISIANENATTEPQQQGQQESNTQLYKERFLVKHSNKFLSIEVNQIAYFYAENRLNFIKTWNNKTYIIDKTIEEISNMLNKKDFFRINRSYILSYKSIDEVYMHFNNRLKLKLNIPVSEEIFVSKDRVAYFKEWLGD